MSVWGREMRAQMRSTLEMCVCVGAAKVCYVLLTAPNNGFRQQHCNIHQRKPAVPLRAP